MQTIQAIQWQQLNWIDYTILITIVLSTAISFLRGFVREAVSLAIWASSVWVAIHYSPAVANSFSGSIASSSLRMLLAFGGLFIGVLVLGALINVIVSTLIDKTGMTMTDRFLGLIFGAARGILVIGVLLMFISLAPLHESPMWQKSQFIPEFHGVVSWLERYVPTELAQASTTLIEKNEHAGILTAQWALQQTKDHQQQVSDNQQASNNIALKNQSL